MTDDDAAALRPVESFLVALAISAAAPIHDPAAA